MEQNAIYLCDILESDELLEQCLVEAKNKILLQLKEAGAARPYQSEAPAAEQGAWFWQRWLGMGGSASVTGESRHVVDIKAVFYCQIDHSDL